MTRQGLGAFGAAFDREDQRSRKRDAVVRAAAVAFNERGFSNTSMDDVAAALGVSKPTLYQYFSSKQEILYECHRLAAFHGEQGLADARAHDGPALDKLLVYVRRFMMGFFDDLGSCAVLLDINSLTEANRDEIARRRDAVSEGVASLIAAGIRDGSIASCDPKLAALFIFGVVNWMSVWYRSGGPKAPDEIASEFLKLFRFGLQSPPEPQ
ncbi:TetR/AcrR family transcriptional regulator [Enterovirga rhinocerotis]|uniref:TetR family transcriptional regulator n=1 Tax=Enterovirga rhinocerotis TaxID=1339210 RepID=A0A4R7C4L2_9HYPH|nr:TetR/AcrR family transcriptional regulator [Enterovirga rhinocerotis]TDR93318.1 TetR family transcriptional regulator [Enterovirga rhinocerotis]